MAIIKEKFYIKKVPEQGAIANISLTRRQLENFTKISSILTEKIRMQISKDGISATIVDPSHVAMMKWEWPANSFTSFEIEQEGEIALDDLKDLLTAVKTAGMSDIIKIRIEDISIEIETKFMVASPNTIDWKMIIIPKMPDFSKLIGCHVNGVSVTWMKEASNGIYRKSELGSLSADTETGQINLSVPNWNYMTHDVDINNEDEQRIIVESRYNTRYLNALFVRLKSAKAETCDIWFGDKLPIHIKTKLPDGAILDYILAPRINEV